jgi:PAS domain S-box-containing protein
MQGGYSDNAQFNEIVRSIGPHDHLCVIYSSREEQFAAIGPSLEIALERGERVVYVTDESSDVAVRDALRETGIDVDRHHRDGTFVIVVGKKDMYIKPGYFHPDWSIHFLSQLEDEAKAAGFSGIRIIGEMTWAIGDDSDSARLIEFEAKVNCLFPQINASGICLYNLNRFPSEVILGVLQTHPLVIYRGDICRNPYYIPPEEFLTRNRAALELERLLSNIQAFRQAEQAIVANEQRWRSIFENSAIGIAMVELDGRFVVTNRAYQDLVGYTATELREMKMPDLTHEDDRENAINLLTKLRVGERKEFQIEHRAVSRDRRVLWIRKTMSLIRDAEGSPRYMMALVEDITERKRAEEDLRKQTEVLQTIFDHIPVMINLTAEDGRLKLVNREWESVLGWQLNEIQKQDVDILAECYPDPRIRQTVLNFRAAARGEWVDFKTRTRDGRMIDTRWAVVKLTDGTTLGIGEDITERKRAEEQLQRSFKQLRELTARLQSVREEERAKVAREIHDELGQALTAIKIDLASLIRAPRADQKEELEKTESILKLVDQTILSVRRIATELRPAILDDLGLVAAVEWAAEEFDARTGTNCRLDLPDEDIVIDQDRTTAIFRIFQETLTNVSRHAEATQVDVRLGREDGNIVLEVRDYGRGIGEEQFAASRSLGILGMRERALLLGGVLTIRGAPGKGTIVRVVIPEVNPLPPLPSEPAC